MMRNIYILILLSLNLLLFNSLKANKFIGGDIGYEQIGQDSFMITANIYVACDSQPLGNIALNLYCSNMTFIDSFICNAVPPIDITPVCKNLCTRCQSQSCSFPYGFGKYQFNRLIVLNNLPSNCCEVIISFERCCRNHSTLVYGPEFYIETKINRCSPYHNNLKFDNDPVSIISIGRDDLIITNADKTYDLPGDSLHYELVTAMKDYMNPVAYANQYSYEKPLYFWGFPNTKLPFPRGFHLDENTGYMSFRPMKIEVPTIAVKVSKFHNGVFLGSVVRDFQIFIINLTNHNPIIPQSSNYYICTGDTLKFSVTPNDYDPNDTLIVYTGKLPPGMTITDNNGLVKHPTADFVFPTDSSMDRKTYTFYVYTEDDFCPVNGKFFKEFTIYVGGQNEKLDPLIYESGCDYFIFDTKYELPYSSIQWSGLVNSNLKKFSYFIDTFGFIPLDLKIVTDTICHRYDTLEFHDTILIHPRLNIDIFKDSTVCKGSFVYLNPTITNAKGKVEFDWSTNDTVPAIWVGPIMNDTTFWVHVSDEKICHKNAYINLKIHPESKIIHPTDFCMIDKDYSLQQMVVPSGGLWFGNAFQNDTFNPVKAGVGVHTLVYSYSFNKSCTTVDSFEFVVHPIPALSLSTDAGKTSFCSNEQAVRLIGHPLGGKWSGPAGIMGNMIYPSMFYKDTSYYYIYEYKDIYSCENKDSIQIRVVPHPNASFNTSNFYCYPDEFNASASFVNAKGIEWEKYMASGDIKSNINDVDLVYQPDSNDLNRGYFLFFLKTNNNDSICKAYIDTLFSFVRPYPIADFGVVAKNDSQNFNCFQFYDSSLTTIGNLYYYWDFDDGSTSQLKNPYHCFVAGDYNVSLRIVTNYHCSDTISKMLKVVQNSIGKDGLNRTELSLYPNPTNDKLTVSSISQIKSYRIYDVFGKEIISVENIMDYTLSISTSDFKNGLYFIKFEMIGGDVVVKDFMKN